MQRWIAAAASVAAGGVLAVAALAGTVVSGLQPGQHMSQFQVSDVSGPAKGETLCYV